MNDKIHTDGAPLAIGPYSQALRVGGFVFTSGQIPLDPASGVIVGDDVETQTKRVCENLREVLSAAGTTFENAIKTTCFLADTSDFAGFNKVYAEYFTTYPARSCVAVKALPKGALVEIEVVAEIV